MKCSCGEEGARFFDTLAVDDDFVMIKVRGIKCFKCGKMVYSKKLRNDLFVKKDDELLERSWLKSVTDELTRNESLLHHLEVRH